MTEQHAIAVLGGGSFGTAVANLLAENGHPVRQWQRWAQAHHLRAGMYVPATANAHGGGAPSVLPLVLEV